MAHPLYPCSAFVLSSMHPRQERHVEHRGRRDHSETGDCEPTPAATSSHLPHAACGPYSRFADMARPPVGSSGPASFPSDGGLNSRHQVSPRLGGYSNTRTSNLDVPPSHLEVSNFGSLDFSQLQIDSDSDSDLETSRRSSRRQGHNRSMSNPFPSLFSNKKKKAKKRATSGLSDSEISDDASPMPRSRNGKQVPAHTQTAATRGRTNTNSCMTGPCITCGSLMRWAQGVEAFRCSICLTVNDLASGDKATDAANAGRPHTSASLNAAAMSIERTRALVQQCIRSYLMAVLSDVDSSSSSAPPPPRVAPSIPGARAVPSPTRPPPPPPPPTSRPPPPPQTSSSKPLPPIPTSISPPVPTITIQNDSSGPEAPLADLDKIRRGIEAKRIFRPLEDDIVTNFLSINCLDNSFVPRQPEGNHRHHREFSELNRLAPSGPENSHARRRGSSPSESDRRPSFGDGAGKTGRHVIKKQQRSTHHRQTSDGGAISSSSSTTRPIRIDWPAVDKWFDTVINAGSIWVDMYDHLVEAGACVPQPRIMLEQIEAEILKGQEHAQRVLLKAIETVLKRPGRRIGESGDFRFLVIALANPLLHASCRPFSGLFQRTQSSHRRNKSEAGRGTGPASGQHSVIIKRILGLISNSSDEWQRQVTACFSRFSDARFVQTKDLVSGFLAYRLVRHNEKKEEPKINVADEFVPRIAEGASMATLQAAISQTSGATTLAQTSGTTPKKPKPKPEKKLLTHGDDWQIKAAVRVLGLLFNANNMAYTHPTVPEPCPTHGANRGTGSRTRMRGQILSTSDFYMTLLDNSDLVADFESWELKTTKFTFCRYPFLLSIWAKIQILEHEARRQMKTKARDAFFDSIMTHRNYDQHFSLSVRRNCLVDDSLTAVSEAVGSGGEDIKKGLRIVFRGEEGIDAGGLRKEWFLLLVREVFNPDHGMFIYDDESQYCYFNPNSFETSDQYFLVGVVLGLAIYNSTILDIALPPFAFRKLLLAGPAPPAGMIAGLTRPSMTYTLADLAEYRPSLAKGLQQLLDYEGDVEAVFALDFTIPVEKYGAVEQVPLCAGGDRRPVTTSNRQEYVDLYIRYMLDTSISRQFEPFKRGFFTVCDSNALLLFRPEEIELLVRGSDERLDVASLRVAASYENWGPDGTAEREPTIQWLWEIFEEASPKDQRKLLTFITSSDRIPATGPASLSIRVLCLGDDTGRFPTARTCFNTLTLYRYKSKGMLQKKLWDAVNESEGFGLK